MVDITGRRKAVFLITSGIDTSLDTNLDKTRKIVQNAGIPIYIIGTGAMFFPIPFPGELTSALQTINALMRNQYSLAYSTGERRDGKRHKIVVKVDVDGDGKPDDKDFVVQARQFYNSPNAAGDAKQ